MLPHGAFSSFTTIEITVASKGPSYHLPALPTGRQAVGRVDRSSNGVYT
jgi:hypothetical protein